MMHPAGGLGWRYRRLWWAACVSNLGDGIRLTALPLLSAFITRQPAAVAGVAVASRLPWLLFALLGGALADRLDRRRLMISTHGARLLVELVLGLAILTHRAGLPLIYGAAFLLGCAETVFDNAAQAMIPTLVPPARRERANGQLCASEVVMNSVVGPAVGGYLFVVAPALPFLLDALSFGAGAALIGTIPGSFSSGRACRRPIRRDITDGIAWLWRHPFLRGLAGLVAALGFFSMMAWSVLVLYALEVLGLDQAAYGALVAVSATGSLAGSGLAGVLRRSLGPPAIMVLSIAGAGASLVALGATSQPWVATAAIGLNGATVVVWNVVTVTLRQVLTPGDLWGRVSSIHRLLAWGSMPLGALVGGAVASQAGLRAPFIVAGTGLSALAWPTWRVSRRLASPGRAVAGTQAR